MNKKILFSLALLLLIFQACTTKPPVEIPKIVFPAYPDEPRIAYLNTYTGEAEPDTTFLTALNIFLGEEVEPTGSSTIVKPYGVGIQDDRLYVADTGSDVVFVIDQKSKKISYLGNKTIGRLSAPVSIAFDSAKTVYVSDARFKKIQGYNRQGDLVFVLGGRLDFVQPTGIAIDKKLKRLYVVDTKAHKFKAYDLATKQFLYEVGKRGREDAQFNYPTNIAVDQRNGNIVIVDTQNFRVQIFDNTGKFIRRFGKVGDKPGMFARPKGIGIDSDGHLYVGDAAFNNIQVFDEMGTLLLYFGSAGYGPTSFRLLSGIYIDENDMIAVADGFSGRVQTFQYLSQAWKDLHPKEYADYKSFDAPKQEDVR